MGNKLNPNAPEFYPSASRSYPAFSGNLPITHPPLQMPRNLPTTHPRPTPVAQALHATRRTLMVFDLDDAVTDQYLYETFRQFGAVEKVERSPNNNPVHFVTFCDAKDARGARRGLHGRMVGPKRIEIKLSHWNSGQNPIPHRLRDALAVRVLALAVRVLALVMY